MPRSAITAKRSKELTRLSRAEFARDQADTLAFADRNREIVELRLVSRVERRADVSVVRAQTATASMISAGSWHRASQPPRFLLANASTSACSRARSVRARRTQRSRASRPAGAFGFLKFNQSGRPAWPVAGPACEAPPTHRVPNVTRYLVFLRPWATIQNCDRKSLRALRVPSRDEFAREQQPACFR
jgi:hypothetical protein